MVEQAVALNPNLAVAWFSLGWVALMCGEAERAIEGFDRMIRLSPLDPLRVGAWNGSSFALFQLRPLRRRVRDGNQGDPVFDQCAYAWRLHRERGFGWT